MPLTPKRPIVDISFRLAAAADADMIYEKLYQKQADTQFLEWFARALSRQDKGRGYYLIATQPSGMIVGQAQLIMHGQRAEIADVIVTADFQNRGIGTAMLDILEQVASERQWRPIEIAVRTENKRAMALYKRLGYVYYRDIPLTDNAWAVVLRKG